VIAGFREKAIAQFSSRRAQITKTTLALAERYEKERGHAPDQRAHVAHDEVIPQKLASWK
jgi:hypothetical protein